MQNVYPYFILPLLRNHLQTNSQILYKRMGWARYQSKISISLTTTYMDVCGGKWRIQIMQQDNLSKGQTLLNVHIHRLLTSNNKLVNVFTSWENFLLLHREREREREKEKKDIMSPEGKIYHMRQIMTMNMASSWYPY